MERVYVRDVTDETGGGGGGRVRFLGGEILL